MTERATRSTTSGRAYLDLQNLARRERRPTDELHQLYALEGFLARLAMSPYKENLVLKGGVLLAAYDLRRPTRDIDFQGRDISMDDEQILRIVREIADIPLDDGISFHTEAASAETIRDEDAYTGVRITFTGTLSVARLVLHIDVSVGDPIWPAPQDIELPRLLKGQIVLTGYPIPMVLAEKIVTAVQRGTANTRWRDFGDIYSLTHRHDVAADQMTAALHKVATYRKTALTELDLVLDGYAILAQQRWAAWTRRRQLGDRLPYQFADVLTDVIAFADPIIGGVATRSTWSAARYAWES